MNECRMRHRTRRLKVKASSRHDLHVTRIRFCKEPAKRIRRHRTEGHADNHAAVRTPWSGQASAICRFGKLPVPGQGHLRDMPLHSPALAAAGVHEPVRHLLQRVKSVGLVNAPPVLRAVGTQQQHPTCIPFEPEIRRDVQQDRLGPRVDCNARLRGQLRQIGQSRRQRALQSIRQVAGDPEWCHDDVSPRLDVRVGVDKLLGHKCVQQFGMRVVPNPPDLKSGTRGQVDQAVSETVREVGHGARLVRRHPPGHGPDSHQQSVAGLHRTMRGRAPAPGFGRVHSAASRPTRIEFLRVRHNPDLCSPLNCARIADSASGFASCMKAVTAASPRVAS